MINATKIIQDLQLDQRNLAEDLIIILGPTASGKTKLAIELAEQIDAEIISVDSRQVYRGMNIGTGKDLSEYKDIPYHLIDIVDPGEKYNISRFLLDFNDAFDAITARGKKVIACGGTGFYLQALLEDKIFTQVPTNLILREKLETFDKEELLALLDNFSAKDIMLIDKSSRKRIIRAIEILSFLKENTEFILSPQRVYHAKVYGLNPSVELRRERISSRLKSRLDEGMLEEIKGLLDAGLSYDDLEYYGLEYKYASYYFKGLLSYDQFFKKLETEIHRYAKRQMTYFRKMEKDGIFINWG